jgi:hypothetical protein
MKKILLGGVALVFLVAGVYHQPILDTIEFYEHQREYADTFARATITWKPIPFDSSRNYGSQES